MFKVTVVELPKRLTSDNDFADTETDVEPENVYVDDVDVIDCVLVNGVPVQRVIWLLPTESVIVTLMLQVVDGDVAANLYVWLRLHVNENELVVKS